MQNKKTWSKEDIQTLNTLRKKKVGFKYIAKVLDRTPQSCYAKAHYIDNPEKRRNRKRKKASQINLTKQPSQSRLLHGEVRKLQNEIKVYQGKVRDLIKEKNDYILKMQVAQKSASEFSRRHSEAEAVIKAFQINIRNYEQRNND